MKILTISLQNIASIEGEHHIELEKPPLQQAGIFALTGATGAGKSTLLDAICLALYNNTPRLALLKSSIHMQDGNSEIGIRDVRTLLRKGASAGYAKVTFTGIDEKVYRAEWHVRRAHHKTSGAVQGERMVLENITDGIPYPENRKTLVLQEIERLVGLSFEQFTKAVLLAQGEFTSFLKSDDNTRAAILEKLTGTEHYRLLSQQIFLTNKAHQETLQSLKIQLDGMDFISPEEVEKLQQTSHELHQKQTNLRQEELRYSDAIRWYETEKKLITERNELEVKVAEMERETNENQARKDYMTRVQHVQEIKSDVWMMDELQQKIELLQQEAKKWAEAKIRIQNAQDEATQHIRALEQEESQFADYAKTQHEKIQEAQKIDLVLAEKKQLLHRITQEHHEVSESLHQNLEQLAITQQNLADVQKNQQVVTQWQEEHLCYEAVAQQEVMIQHSLEQSLKQLDPLRKLHEKIKHLETSLTQEKDVLDAEEKVGQTLVIELDKQVCALQELKLQKKDTDLETLEKKRTDLSQKERLYETGWQALDFYLKEVSQQKALLEKHESLEETLHKHEIQILEVQQAIQEGSIELTIHENYYNRWKLQQSENVVSLRAQLVNHEACPVCGSTTHPLVSHAPKAPNLLHEVENNYEQAKAHVSNLTHQQTELRIQIERNQESLIAVREKRTEQDRQLQTYKAQWENFVSKTQKLEATEDTLHALPQTLAHLKEKLRTTELQILEYNQWIKEVHHLQDSVETQREKHRTFQLTFDQQVQRYHENQHALTHAVKESQLLNEQWNRTKEQITTYVPAELLLNDWHLDIVATQTKISTCIAAWRKSELRLEALQEEHQKLMQNQTFLSQENTRLTAEVEKKKNQLSQESENYRALEKLRYSHLENQSTAQALLALETSQKQFDQRKSVLSQKLHEGHISEATTDVSIQENQKAHKAHLEQKHKKEHQIYQWIQKQSDENEKIGLEDVRVWARHTTDWLQQEQLFFTEKKEAKLRLSTLLEAQINALQQHQQYQVPSLLLEELQLKLKECQTQSAQTSEALATLKSQLMLHEKQQIHHQKIVKEIEDISEKAKEWAQLNDLIGSSDGSKFRKLAQEYTLDILLRYANVHLSKMSKRYTLERIPKSLSMQVIDHDMGYEIRSIFSLSGGESFLVSLAMALALSSLSSTRLNVETLFIDEGFGTLDAETLSVALDALESLQHQGKKVGVISHVQEMTERIGVKIHVKKMGNGKSTIEIQEN